MTTTIKTAAEEIADAETKAELLRRMRHYVRAEAKRKKCPEWSIVGAIFGHGSGVSAALWYDHINVEDEPK